MKKMILLILSCSFSAFLRADKNTEDLFKYVEFQLQKAIHILDSCNYSESDLNEQQQINNAFLEISTERQAICNLRHHVENSQTDHLRRIENLKQRSHDHPLLQKAVRLQQQSSNS